MRAGPIYFNQDSMDDDDNKKENSAEIKASSKIKMEFESGQS